METIEVNRKILNDISIQYPNSVRELKIEGTNLIFNNEKCDISNFNLYDLINGDSEFAHSLSNLSSEDIFRIIRLHANLLKSQNNDLQNNNKNKIEIIKQENPFLKNITIVERPNGVSIDEFINIVDSKGENHVFKNDTNVDIFSIYEQLKVQYGNNITPDLLIDAINRKLYEIRMSNERNIDENNSEDFKNKIEQINKPYKNDNGYQVQGNEENDIAIVVDKSNPEKSEIKTFTRDNGDLVINSHSQNVSGTVTNELSNNQSTTVNSTSEVNNEISSEKQIEDNKEIEQKIKLIPLEDFYKLYSPDKITSFNEEERDQVNLYYAYFGDLILYEDYLLPELRDILNKLRNFILNIELNIESRDQATERQQELLNKRDELEEKKKNNNISTDLNKEQEYIKKLLLEKPNDTGSISIIQVLMIILVIVIVFTIITLSVIK